MLRDVRTARSTGRPFRDAFPHSLPGGYAELERTLTGEIASIRTRQDASHRTSHQPTE